MRRVTSTQKIRIARLHKRRFCKKGLRRLAREARCSEIEIRRLSHRQMLLAKGLFAGSDIDRRPIILPAVFSYWDNFQETAEALAEIREYGVKRRVPLDIRFDQVRQLDPSATLALAAEIYRCRKLRIYRRGVFITGNYPVLNDIHTQLSDMGFFRLLEIADKPINLPIESRGPHPIFLKFLTDTKVVGATVDAFVSIVERHIVALNEVARGRLVGAIKEAMGNVNEHAYVNLTKYQSMKRRWYLSSRIDIENHEVMIMLYDQGVGIPETIDADLLETIRAALAGGTDMKLHVSDGYTIKLATEIWRTATGQGGRGRGFRDMKRFVDHCNDGQLRVLSNRGSYTYITNSESFDDLPLSSGGTIIEWRFRSETPVEMADD
jgi:anti-sigma regulatory factor (Ser/Thr protein kinase)